jgi:hypothetical protein
MAIQNQRHHEIVVQDNHPNWPELLSKTVDDLSRIGRTEIELLETRLKHLIEAQTNNIAGMLVWWWRCPTARCFYSVVLFC